jgi:hypothetical protein
MSDRSADHPDVEMQRDGVVWLGVVDRARQRTENKNILVDGQCSPGGESSTETG